MGKADGALTAIEAISGGSRGTVSGVDAQTADDAGVSKAARAVHAQKGAGKTLTSAGREALRRWYETRGLQLIIERDGTTGKMIAVLVNPATRKIVRQVPMEDLLKLAQSIDQYQGFLVDRTR